MPSPIFSKPGGVSPSGGYRANTGNPVFDIAYASNPAFRRFADAMRGKDPRTEFRNRGYDYDECMRKR